MTKLPPPVKQIKNLSGSPEAIPLIKRRSLIYAVPPGLSTRSKPALQTESLHKVDESSEHSLSEHNDDNHIPLNDTSRQVRDMAIPDLPFRGYRPGTLRIINGSPAPSLPSNSQAQSKASSIASDTEVDALSYHIPTDDETEYHSEIETMSTVDTMTRGDATDFARNELYRISTNDFDPDLVNYLNYDNDIEARGLRELSIDEVKAEQNYTTSASGSETIHAQPFSFQVPAPVTKSRQVKLRPPTPPQRNNSEKLKHAPIISRKSAKHSPTTSTSLTSNKPAGIMTRPGSASSLDSVLADVPEESELKQTHDGRAIPNGKAAIGTFDIPQNRPFTCQRQKPKTLEEMIYASSGGQHSLPASPVSTRSHHSRSSLGSTRTGSISSVPLNYVPFEPTAPGAVESKIKFYRAPAHWSQEQKDMNPDFGMRIQKPRPIGDLKMIPRSMLPGSKKSIEVNVPREILSSNPRGPRPILAGTRSISASAIQTKPILSSGKHIRIVEPDHKSHKERTPPASPPFIISAPILK